MASSPPLPSETSASLIKDHSLRFNSNHVKAYYELKPSNVRVTSCAPSPSSSSCFEGLGGLIGLHFLIMEKKLGSILDPTAISTLLKIHLYYPMIIHVDLEKDFVEKLCDYFHSPHLQILGKIEDCGYNGGTRAVIPFDKRIKLQDILSSMQKYGDMTNLKQCFPVASDARSGNCIFSINVRWTELPETKHTIQATSNATSYIQNLYENEPTKDLVIVTGNGAEVKCHKLIFAAQSPVLSAMLTPSNGMKEAESGRVELKENSEDGIRLLLRYLYGLELVTEDISCDLVVELFQLAHKYDLEHLQSSLYELLLKKDMKWFTPDVILELYFYVRNFADFKTLTAHALTIMSGVNAQQLRNCELFKSLDPDTAIDLFCELFKVLQRKKLVANKKGVSNK